MKYMSGRVYNTLDEKKRFRIPSKFKNDLPEEPLFYVHYLDDCLALMPESVYNRFLARFDNVDFGDLDMIAAKRRLSSISEAYSEDRYGRSAIPRFMLRDAEIEKDVVTIGMGDYLEIWALDKLEAKDAELSIDQANRIAYLRKKEETQRREGI